VGTTQGRVQDESMEAVLPVGAPTGVGSLPHTDRAEAVDFVLDRTPELPAAPTLPRLDPREQMIPQAAWGIQGVHVADDGTLSVPDPSQLDPEAPLGDRDLTGPPFTTWRAFLDRVAGRQGPIKLQVTGPVTLGQMLIQAGVDARLAYDVARSAVATRAGDLLDRAEAVGAGTRAVLVFDEPGLVGGLRPELALDPDALIDVLSGALAAVEARAVTGVHCCGPADWRAVLNAGPRILSLPVGADATGSAGAIGAFLERGGWVAWGAVATNEPLGEQPSRSWRQLSSQWCELVQAGCDPVLLRRQALVTPVCGLALHDEAQADHVFALTRRLAERIHDQVMGIRLSVGA
jgi:methionine synthase II (cobalamin-independent)